MQPICIIFRIMTKSAKIAQWTDDETAAWTSLVRANQHLLQSVETALKEKDLPPLTWYDVLWELEKARPRGLRLNDLGSRTLLDKYNVTRLVTRLEKEGLARRMNCPGDARGIIALITPKGSRLRKRMWPVYSRTVREEFFSRLSQGEIASLRKLLGRVLNAPNPAPGRKSAKSV
jgi:DNA-binding MarR family transcriptional regulator